jgi:hypothetical protein
MEVKTKNTKEIRNLDILMPMRYKVSAFSISYENSPWKYVLGSMIGYALQPIVFPIMILLSKLLKRKIDWFPVWNK